MFPEVDRGTLATIASVISSFGIAMLFFRILRQLEMGKKGEAIWLPVADWLLVLAIILSLLVVIVPLLILSQTALPAAASGAAAIMVAGYVFAILGHYRIFFGGKRTGLRDNPEPWELFFVVVALIAALCFFLYRLVL
jgi:hypothetical protein